MQRSTHKATILGAAVSLARETPYHQLSLRDIAHAAECSSALVMYHYETMSALRDAIVEYAREHVVYRILGDAIVQKHPTALMMPASVRDEAIRQLTA